ncbi:putative Chloride channel protein k [Rhodotorula toruloides ATCC 204091]|nr:putative Chloride channel protein k [Rhodotorula toruloides ATCC 204091]
MGDPSVQPSRRRRLSLKALTNPFRRTSDTPSFDFPAFEPPPLPGPDDDLPPSPPRIKIRVDRAPANGWSKKLRRRSLVERVQGEKGLVVEQKARKERGSDRRKSSLSTASDAADIKERWMRQQDAVVLAKDLEVSLFVPPASDTPSSNFRFPSLEPSPRGSSLQHSSPSPRHADGPFPTLPYSTYAPPVEPPASPTTRDLMRMMAKPFPSKTATLRAIDHSRNISTADSLVTPASSTDLDETRQLSYMFPVPPERTSPQQPEQAQLAPLSTSFPAADPQDSDAILVSPKDVFRPRPPRVDPRPVSAVEASSTARPWTPVDQRRPSSMSFPSVAPAPLRRLSRAGTSDSLELASTSTQARSSNPAGVVRRPISIPSQRGGQRISASLLLAGDVPAPAHGAGSVRAQDRASWASMQSQASSGSGRGGSSGDQRRLSRRLSRAEGRYEEEERVEGALDHVLDPKMEALVRELGI